MTSQHNKDFRRLRLDIAVHVEPVQGQLVDDDGVTGYFTGWLDLVEMLEGYRADHTGVTGRGQPQ